MMVNKKAYKEAEPHITTIKDKLYKFSCPYCSKQNIYVNRTQALYNSHMHLINCSKRCEQTKLKENKK